MISAGNEGISDNEDIHGSFNNIVAGEKIDTAEIIDALTKRV